MIGSHIRRQFFPPLAHTGFVLTTLKLHLVLLEELDESALSQRDHGLG